MRKFHLPSGSGLTQAMVSMYFIMWGAQYIGYNYIPIYVNALPFATNTTTGLAVAMGAVATTLSQPIWGIWADRAKTKNRILFIAFFGVALTSLLFLLPHKSLLSLLAAIVVFYCFFLAPQTLIDTITVENISKASLPFGSVRGFSSAGAAAMAFVFSLIAVMTDQKAFLLMGGAALAASIPLAFIPKTKGHARGQGKMNMLVLLRNKRLLLFLCYGFCLFVCSSMLSTFFPVYYATERGLNAGTQMLGVFMTIAIITEASIMIFGVKWLRRFHPYTLFLFTSITGVFRCLLLYFLRDPKTMLVCTVFQAMWFAPLWSSVAPYINRVVPDEYKASGQSLWSIVIYGFAPVIGSLLGGLLSDALNGIRPVFLLVCGMMAVMSIVFCILFSRQRRLDKKEGWDWTHV